MKTKFSFFIIALVAIISSLTVLGQEPTIECPDGYTLKEAFLRYWIDEQNFCDITVYYCCKWDEANNQATFEIELMEETTVDGHCMDYIDDQTLNIWVRDQITTIADLACNPIPPDPDYVIEVIKIPSCMYWENKQVPPYGEDVYRLRKWSCNTNWCVYVYHISYDYRYNPPKLIRTLVNSYEEGTYICPTTKPEIPPPGKTMDEYWITDCFKIPCEE
ncbi:MAG: hypothetical protein A2X61_15875 [Ignavibacteria bacterium GWB2_35_12]|nr:MAG: hypothetical protein A2X61_15875 [Ignavibacteria bacterium GWB2_35_12]OGU87142.1 MAG: hypothetical protein A2220_08250 [Ignavibacteria bacterium RIFOXYA2_FULL_35_10]OGV24677.1 MAG: hypothetical protein A2475_14650 [Ignavibacteria bacterium RIFOXYC2_FULL_35_21]